jgi:hypothetical protein
VRKYNLQDKCQRVFVKQRIDEMHLAENCAIQGIPARADTFLLFHENGTLSACRLDKDHCFTNIICKAGEWIGFYDTGSLKRCVVAEDTSRDDLLLRADSWVAFHGNGVVENYKLTEDAVIQGVVCNKGDVLMFDEDGRITETIKLGKSAS